MTALGRIALARTDIDMADAVFEVVSPVLEATPDADADTDAMEIDGKEDGSSRKAEEL